jgi:hypothetical protein
MVLHKAFLTSGSVRAGSWETAIVARPEVEADALLPGHRWAAATVALLALMTLALPVLLAGALLFDPDSFARAFS